VREEAGAFRRLHVVPAIVTDQPTAELPFFLAQYPSCSSVLEPDEKHLADWEFAELFRVVEKTRLPATTLAKALGDLGLSRIDWFKTDSQGLDLRLFRSLDEPIRQRVLAAEFEPGILDAYRDEDKLHELMAYMDGQDFWMSALAVCGTRRISQQTLASLDDATRRQMPTGQRISPGWAEVAYLNTFARQELFTVRDLLLGWVFATVEDQHGFAIDLARQGQRCFGGEAVFEELAQDSAQRIQTGPPSPGSPARRLLRRVKRQLSPKR
jgi:hypothetical protein